MICSHSNATHIRYNLHNCMCRNNRDLEIVTLAGVTKHSAEKPDAIVNMKI